MLLDTGSFAALPWWVFVIMPFMMLGMVPMMWLMMRMMGGMGGHGSSDPSTAADHAHSGESEMASLRRQLAQLQQQLAAVKPGPGADDQAASPAAPEDDGAPGGGKAP